MSVPSYSLFCMGNPLLDMQVRNGEKLLEKYGLKANDAILADEKQSEMFVDFLFSRSTCSGIDDYTILNSYDELVREHQVTYVAGGAAQNAARGAAYVLSPGSVVYTGAVGDDELAEQLKAANKREGLDEVYQVQKGEKTGACAVVITGHHRSLVTTLRVAEKFEKSHLSSPEVAPLINNAKFFYIEGYFLTHGTFVMNLSAPFIAQFFGDQLNQIFPHTDIVIGNEAEAEAWATANNYPDVKDLNGIAKAIATLPKANSKPRVVVFTQGALHTVLVTSDKPDEPKIFPVNVLEDSQIVDTNGAGDAFAGGFLGGLVAGKDLEGSVLAGHALARQCVQQVGPQYPWPKVDIL
ncbi:hypothetical protein CVT25_002637 [Psilocybe cyanescens]|uniref:Adenosine kinase n=1 Tax=Psilocybe cyanescens TaxID=93625 RepID=A0A409WLJ2_PSICY|nr:hypothetical protein CVT25_002637 [Psilocybe cyanescens]